MPAPRRNSGTRPVGSRAVGVYPGGTAALESGIKQKMSNKNPGARRRTGKRRKVEEEGTSESAESSVELHEEEDDLFRSHEYFEENARRLAGKKWVEACDTLASQMEEHVRTLAELKASGRLCARCEGMVEQGATTASNYLMKSQHALQEFARRYLRALRDMDSEARGRKELTTRSEEQGQGMRRLAEERKTLERERDQLLAEKEEMSTRCVEREKGLGRLVERLTKEREETELERDQQRAEKEAILLRSQEGEERLGRLIEEKRELEKERDQLRAALAKSEEGGRGEDSSAPEHRDGDGYGDGMGGSYPPLR